MHIPMTNKRDRLKNMATINQIIIAKYGALHYSLTIGPNSIDIFTPCLGRGLQKHLGPDL